MVSASKKKTANRNTALGALHGEYTAERRWKLERVCDRHGVNYHPTTGVGQAQAFLKDVLEELGGGIPVDVAGEIVRGVVEDSSLEAFTPDVKSLTATLVHGFEYLGSVTVVDKLDMSGDETRKMIERLAVTPGGGPSECPCCGADAALDGVVLVPAKAFEKTVHCGEGGGGGCGMPSMDWFTWERLPRHNRIDRRVLEDAVRGVVEGWSYELFAQDPREKLTDAVREAFATGWDE